jgi:hypothetical protein
MTFIFEPTRKLVYALDALPYVECGSLKVYVVPDPDHDDPWQAFLDAWQRHVSTGLEKHLSAILCSKCGRRNA